MNSSIGIAPPKPGTLQPSVAALFGKMKNALPKRTSSAKPSGASTAIVLQNALRGNLRSGRQANHHARTPMGIMNSARLQVYPSGVGLSEVACKMAGCTTLRNDMGGWVNDRSQWNGSRDNEPSRDGKYDVERF